MHGAIRVNAQCAFGAFVGKNYSISKNEDDFLVTFLFTLNNL